MELLNEPSTQLIEQMKIWCVRRSAAVESSLWSETAIFECLRTKPFLAGLNGDQLVGIILYQDLGKALEILYLESHPQFRRHGFMTELFELWVGQNPGKEIWLEVHADNMKAHRFYKKLGFERTGERPNYYADGGSAILFNYSR